VTAPSPASRAGAAGSTAPVDPAGFRRAMGRWPTGVSIVTTRADGVDSGLTVNAFLSVALDPPLVLVSLAHEADSTPRVQRSGRFVVHVLGARHRPLSERFARAAPPEEKFEGLAIARGLGELPILEGTLAVLECAVREAHDVADHRLFVGAVERLSLGADEAPLVFFRGRYAEAETEGRLRLPDPRP